MKLNKNSKKILKLILFGVTIILIFTIIFCMFDHTHFIGLEEEDDNDILNKMFHRLYYTMSTLSSAGYGDITPKSYPIKIVSILLQLILIVSLMSGLINLFE